MRLRGKVQVDRFGPMTLDDYELQIGRYAWELGVEVEMFGSSSEGDVIEKLYDSHAGDVDAAVINPAGFMRGYPA
jgi:3-dehydroquinate dehydratase-2